MIFIPPIDVSQLFITKAILFVCVLAHFLYREYLLSGEGKQSVSVSMRALDFLFLIIPLAQLWNPELGKVSFLNHYIFNSVGVLLCVTGFAISIIGKHSLGGNWSTGWEYQVKKNQTLTESGVYKHIRHPIYTGIMIGFTGFELALANISAIMVPVFMLSLFYIQAKKEEELLLDVFQDDYRTYMQRTKMFIPFIF